MLLCNSLVGALPYSHYVMRSFPLCGVRVLHPAHYDQTRRPSRMAAKKTSEKLRQKNKQKTAPWLSSSHAVIGMFYGVVASQRQPQYTCNVLQRRCQPRPTIIYIEGKGGGGREGGGLQKEISQEGYLKSRSLTRFSPGGFFKRVSSRGFPQEGNRNRGSP